MYFVNVDTKINLVTITRSKRTTTVYFNTKYAVASLYAEETARKLKMLFVE